MTATLVVYGSDGLSVLEPRSASSERRSKAFDRWRDLAVRVSEEEGEEEVVAVEEEDDDDDKEDEAEGPCSPWALWRVSSVKTACAFDT